MATCDPQSLMDAAACFACRPESEKSTLELALLYAWSGSTQTVQELVDEAGCFNCRTASEKSTLETQLLCEILNAGPQPLSIEFINEIDSDGGYTGGVTVVATGGTGPYTYQWTDDAFIQPTQYTDVLEFALGPSDWTVQVTDSLGEIVTEPWHVYRAEHTGSVQTCVTKAIVTISYFDPSLTYDSASLNFLRFQQAFITNVSTTLVATMTGVSYLFVVTNQTSRGLVNNALITADVGGTEDFPFELNLPGSVQDAASTQRIYGPTSRLTGQSVSYGSATRTYDSGTIPIPSPSVDFDGLGILDASVTAFSLIFTPLNAWTGYGIDTRRFGFTACVIYDYHCARQ